MMWLPQTKNVDFLAQFASEKQKMPCCPKTGIFSNISTMSVYCSNFKTLNHPIFAKMAFLDQNSRFLGKIRPKNRVSKNHPRCWTGHTLVLGKTGVLFFAPYKCFALNRTEEKHQYYRRNTHGYTVHRPNIERRFENFQ